MAKRFEDVFRKAFVSYMTGRVKAGAADARHATRYELFVAHPSLTLNRELAARLAPNGLPADAAMRWFEATGLQHKKHLFTALQVTPSTLSRARPDTTLDVAVTERMLRQSELFVRAAQVFGDEGTAWMTMPHELLDGKSPVEYAANEFGGAKVREMLTAIEYGGVV